MKKMESRFDGVMSEMHYRDKKTLRVTVETVLPRLIKTDRGQKTGAGVHNRYLHRT